MARQRDTRVAFPELIWILICNHVFPFVTGRTLILAAGRCSARGFVERQRLFTAPEQSAHDSCTNHPGRVPVVNCTELFGGRRMDFRRHQNAFCYYL
jgi:hypothetical protein